MQDYQVPADVEAEVFASIASSPGGWTHTTYEAGEAARLVELARLNGAR